MNSRTMLTILLVASLAGNASFLLTAFLKRPAQHSATLDQLSLSADQASKFEAAKRTFRDERMRAHKRMSGLREVLVDEFQKETPDRQRLLRTAAEMAQVQTNMRPKLIEHLLVLHAVLTPAQRATLAKIMRGGGWVGAACPGAVLYSDQER